jgi:16S rRNA (adenine1518-N6/adenine1519-N6)-dimethyltransferase
VAGNSGKSPGAGGRASSRTTVKAPSPKKSLSQRFLKSAEIREAILKSIEADSEDVIVEIGAGAGALTRGLGRTGARVIAVEVDRELAEYLAESVEPFSNVSVLCCNILELDLKRIADRHETKKLVVVGNLPYHLTTQVLLYLIEHRAVVSTATVMVQKEYAHRLLATPGGREYGAITLRTAYSASVSKVLEVPSSAFYPKPKVDSTVLKLTFRDKPPVRVADEETLFAVIRGSFGQRRKMLVNSLVSISGLDKAEVKGVCRSVGIDPGRRPETLSLEEFARLADVLRSKK